MTEQEKLILELYREHIHICDIAKEFNTTVYEIANIIKLYIKPLEIKHIKQQKSLFLSFERKQRFKDRYKTSNVFRKKISEKTMRWYWKHHKKKKKNIKKTYGKIYE